MVPANNRRTQYVKQSQKIQEHKSSSIELNALVTLKLHPGTSEHLVCLNKESINQ
jgi:hypothetical protein